MVSGAAGPDLGAGRSTLLRTALASMVQGARGFAHDLLYTHEPSPEITMLKMQLKEAALWVDRSEQQKLSDDLDALADEVLAQIGHSTAAAARTTTQPPTQTAATREPDPSAILGSAPRPTALPATEAAAGGLLD